ncbi:MAG: hypothetical protein RIB03_07340 [Henriciella sp.]|uniref:DUF3309 domain-containing protein n=1 Tax=Henriciella sp. TaxID=1968823 RepID=UPI0032ED4F41
MFAMMIFIVILLVFLTGAFSRQCGVNGYGLGRSGIGIATLSVSTFISLILIHSLR